MKKLLLNLGGISMTLCFTANLLAQSTPGTLTFTYTQTAASMLATKNILAIWIEDNAGTFIKTRVRYVGNGTNDHLPTWMSKSSGGAASNATATSCNIVDATTGATRKSTTTPTAFGAQTIAWNGTDVNGSVVADGIYKIWIESSYCLPEPANGTHALITSYSFTKSTITDHVTPTGDSNFGAITIDWVPSGTTGVEGISGNPEFNISPNPTDGILNISYVKASHIKVINTLGVVVFEEKTNGLSAGTKIVDLSNFANGIYLIDVSNAKGSSKNSIILNK